MSPTPLLPFTGGTIMGASPGFADLSFRAFDRTYPPKLITDSTESSRL